eukprot:CAMPEP_0194297728 /NCGR_PEP_ID=MMETSP0169-20130528/59634_1 /TAXON_ID=218684 /ORGANISM="Corethron pennatum, Strain L29A3" /LENGTH=102 /DNA_ID=CAMNT_0039047611 /DNA_START=64 /DNA_END=369 /DNA_ORIENTATION=+
MASRVPERDPMSSLQFASSLSSSDSAPVLCRALRAFIRTVRREMREACGTGAGDVEDEEGENAAYNDELSDGSGDEDGDGDGKTARSGGGAAAPEWQRDTAG